MQASVCAQKALLSASRDEGSFSYIHADTTHAGGRGQRHTGRCLEYPGKEQASSMPVLSVDVDVPHMVLYTIFGIKQLTSTTAVREQKLSQGP